MLRRIFFSIAVKTGDVLEGVVKSITNFGAFIQLPDGETGLVHISEVANSYVKDINDYLQKDDQVKVKVLSIDDNGKIALSIKQAEVKKEQNKKTGADFEDKLSRFLKESDERQHDIKKNTESKRGNRQAF